MTVSPLLDQLIDALRCLPSVGPKSAQRMAYHLMERDRQGAQHLAERLQDAVDKMGHCQRCRTFTEYTICDLCKHPGRDHNLLCVVESPADVQAIEQSADFRGLYFVLMGHLSPLDGIGPADIGLEQLAQRLDEGEIKEVILATNATVEGETTAHYIGEMVSARNIKATRIAHGVPIGGELEYVNGTTLAHAFSGRGEI